MFKKLFQLMGFIFLIGFSFFYTDKVVMVVRNQDPLMIKIQEYASSFNKDSVDVSINDNSIIPGINACVVDINKSYLNMKKIGVFSTSMIEYKEIKPKLSITNIYDKYIIKGNKDKLEVGLIFQIKKDKYINDILFILDKYKIKASFFIDGKVIEENNKIIRNLVNKEHEIYNLGYDNKYNQDYILWTNSIIDNTANNKSRYCLINKEDKTILELCSKNKMYTLKSNLNINYSNTFNDIKNNIDKGSFINIEINDNNITELNKTILYLHSKGYNYRLLSKLLDEKGCN